jgi:outer membrane lipoprotein-sorting protein
VTPPDDATVRRLLEELAGVKPTAKDSARALTRVRSLLAKPAVQPSRWRIPMLARIAAGVVVAVGGSILLFGWIKSSGAAPTFAEVQEKVQATRTVKLTQTTTMPDGSTEKSRIFVQAPGLLRAEGDDGSYAIIDSVKHQSLAVNPKEKKATLLLGMSDKIGPGNFYEMIRNMAKDVVENLPEKTIGSKKAVGYRVRVEFGDEKKEANVWVDADTKLPVRVELSEKDKTGRGIATVISDFVFDAPMNPTLFRMTPPEGYQVTTLGSATPLPAAPTDADQRAPLVSPGVGIGPVRFGMSKEEVIKAIGQPDSIPPEGKGIELRYASRGFSLNVTPSRGLVMIFCYTQKTTFWKTNDFQGKTKEGIVMGDSEKKIVATYGKPNSREEREGGTIYLQYSEPSIHFTLFGDKLVQYMLQMTRPPEKK